MGGKKTVLITEAIQAIDAMTPAEVDALVAQTKQAITEAEAHTATLKKQLLFLEKWQLAQA